MNEKPGLGENWLPVGEEPLTTGSITECTILRRDGISVVALANGDIDTRRHPSTGMYHNDTRYLSTLTFSLSGIEPVLLDSAHAGQVHSAIFTNRAMVSPSGHEEVPARALVIRRRRLVMESLREALSLSNYSARTVRFDLRLELGTDFHDIFEVRGYERRGSRSAVQVDKRADGVTYTYEGADNLTRTCILQFSIPPLRLEATGAVFNIELEPRASITLDILVGVDAVPKAMPFAQVVAAAERADSTYLSSVTEIETDDERLNDALRRALLDIGSLWTDWNGNAYTAAGAPWFDALFGRDSLITGMLMLPCNPGLLRSTLLLLAKYQAEETDPANDASPGKIPHELRWGELARSGEVPFGRYYGSVDSTPLFLMAAGEYLDWTGDVDAIRELWPALLRAHHWCIDNSQDGWLGYERTSAVGLENQGWKDSHDAIVWPDGQMAAAPIKLVEVQGYLIAAHTAFGRMASALGEPGGDEASATANNVRARLDSEFAVAARGYGLGLDGAGSLVPTAASNQGHLLWAGAASASKAREVATRLLNGDLFSGWGVRTLSTEAATFNPLGYHTGSVWPHDNAIIVGGLKRYGFNAEAGRLATALMEAALAFSRYQVPELFSGDDRDLRLVPTPYPVASRPQAWSAASLPYLVTTLLGIRPAGPSKLAIVRPLLPGNIGSIKVRNLRYHEGSVDLVFRRQGEGASVEVERIRGDLEIALSKV